MGDINSYAAAKWDANLVCYGCAHSAAQRPHPSCPSGERPCAMCVRNPEVRTNGPMAIHAKDCPKNPAAARNIEEAAQRLGDPNSGWVNNAECTCKPKYLSPFYNGDLADQPKVYDNYRTMDLRDQMQNAYEGGLKEQTRAVLHDFLKVLTDKHGKELVRELISADSTRRLLGEE